jgi:hypothetical protein
MSKFPIGRPLLCEILFHTSVFPLKIASFSKSLIFYFKILVIMTSNLNIFARIELLLLFQKEERNNKKEKPLLSWPLPGVFREKI